jgi:hypothetical protein
VFVFVSFLFYFFFGRVFLDIDSRYLHQDLIYFAFHTYHIQFTLVHQVIASIQFTLVHQVIASIQFTLVHQVIASIQFTLVHQVIASIQLSLEEQPFRVLKYFEKEIARNAMKHIINRCWFMILIGIYTCLPPHTAHSGHYIFYMAIYNVSIGLKIKNNIKVKICAIITSTSTVMYKGIVQHNSSSTFNTTGFQRVTSMTVMIVFFCCFLF